MVLLGCEEATGPDESPNVPPVPHALLLILLTAMTAGVGTLVGLGGAVILVPALVVFGWLPSAAAPLGLISVVGGSIAAGPRQLADRTVNHRLGVTTELAATSGAIIGAIASNFLPDSVLVYLLAASAVAAALLSGRRTSRRNPVDPSLGDDQIGERIGGLWGAYPLDGGVAPYRVNRLPLGLALMSIAGFVAGTTGTSGGFIKTPVTSEVMHAPTKVAASTTRFTIGITASAALLVYFLQGRVDVTDSSAAIVGSLAGGVIGAIILSHLPAHRVRQSQSLILITIAIILVTTR